MTPEQREEMERAQAEMVRLMREANGIAEFIMKRLQHFGRKPGKPAPKTIDARAVAVACARVAGVYISMIDNPVIRRHYRDQFPIIFQKLLDTPMEPIGPEPKPIEPWKLG